MRAALKYPERRAMERLTARNEHGEAYLTKCFKEPCSGQGSSSQCDSCDFMHRAIEKLAEYEDLGITADQMKEIDELYKQRCEDINCLKEEM